MDQISKSPIVGEDTFIVSIGFVQLFNLVYTPCARLFLTSRNFMVLGSRISSKNRHVGFMWMPCEGMDHNS